MTKEKKQFDLTGYDFIDGAYVKRKTTVQPRDQIKKHKHTGTASAEPLSFHEFLVSQGKSVLTIPGIVHGLNGDEGLMREHMRFGDVKRKKNLYLQIIKDHMREGRVRQHEGKVKVRYIGYKSILMDWDNFCSSFKHIGDSLQKAGAITSDKPDLIIEFLPSQVKVKRIEQKVVVIIENVQ